MQVRPKTLRVKPVEYLDFLTEEEYLGYFRYDSKRKQYLDDNDPNKFIAKMGAEALYELLKRLDLDALILRLRHKANTETSQQRKNEALKRLQVVEALEHANDTYENRPEWMIVKVVPVIPPELRPLVPLDGGRFATSDLERFIQKSNYQKQSFKTIDGD